MARRRWSSKTMRTKRAGQLVGIDHADLGTQFVMAALIQRDAPVTGQYVAIGAGSGSGGLRAVFYYSNKSVAGGYGIGVQWGLSQTPPLAANDPGRPPRRDCLRRISGRNCARLNHQRLCGRRKRLHCPVRGVVRCGTTDAGRAAGLGRKPSRPSAYRASLQGCGTPRGQTGRSAFRGEPLMIAFGVLADRIRANGHRVSTEVS